MTDPILTLARRSLWDAIDNFEDLDGVFRSKWKYENDIGHYFEKYDKAGMGDFPSIGIMPMSVQPDWVLNEMMEFSDAYTIDIRAQKLTTCERLVELAWKAIYQAAPVASPTVSYVRAATGYLPKTLGPIQRTPIGMGPNGLIRVWQFQLGIGLRLRQDPFAAT